MSQPFYIFAKFELWAVQDSVTHKFPDGNFARPHLAIFAFRFAQTKI